MNHKVIRIDDLMYNGCEPHWRCVYCGVCIPFHCYGKEDLEKMECDIDTIISCGRIDYSEERAKVAEARAAEAYNDGLRTGHKNNEYREELWDAERDRLRAELDKAKTACGDYNAFNEENESLAHSWMHRAQVAESRYDALRDALNVPDGRNIHCCYYCVHGRKKCPHSGVECFGDISPMWELDLEAWRERNNEQSD